MSITISNFSPKNCNADGNYTIAASTTGTNQVMQQPPSGTYGANGYNTILITNSASSAAFLSWGMTNQAGVVSTSSFQVPPGAVMTIDMGFPATNIAAILASGTGNVYISLGNGS